jgi:hypothetical protein
VSDGSQCDGPPEGRAVMPFGLNTARPIGMELGTDPAAMQIESGLVTYCLLYLVPAIVNGTPRRDAAQESWDLFRRSHFLARYGAVIDPNERHSTRCVAAVCECVGTTQFRANRRRI